VSIEHESWSALGTTAAVVVSGGSLTDARRAVEQELDAIDRACSRFREDSELMRLNRSDGAEQPVSELLYGAVEVALRVAAATDGLVDPTVGPALEAIGYDRDFESIDADGPEFLPVAAPGWGCVQLDPESRTVRLLKGARLDLGATAKAWAADRAARRAASVAGGPVLVNLGGDISVVGAPAGGWSVALADDHAATGAGAPAISVVAGGLATSSTTVRKWRRGGRAVHHIVDPSSGRPALTPWRTVTVAAATCVDANAATTASIVLGDAAPVWLAGLRVPARLVAADGQVLAIGGWPAEAKVA
jgi:thiamine biosynthesis lipoprotein